MRISVINSINKVKNNFIPFSGKKPVDRKEYNYGYYNDDLPEFDYDEISDDVLEEKNEYEKINYKNLIQTIKKYKKLTREEEKYLSIQIKKGGEEGEKARNKLVLSNLRLVLYVANKFKNAQSMTKDDIIQEGIIGLIKAAAPDYDSDYAFSTYAYPKIYGEIYNALKKRDKSVYIPPGIVEKGKIISDIIQSYRNEKMKEPSISELSAKTGFDQRKIKRIMKYWNSAVYSLNQRIYDSDNKKKEWISMLTDNNPDNHPSQKIDNDELNSGIKKMLDRLPETQRNVVIMSYGLFGNQPMEQKEIGQKLGISYQAVQHRLQNAFRRMKLNSAILEKYKELLN